MGLSRWTCVHSGAPLCLRRTCALPCEPTTVEHEECGDGDAYALANASSFFGQKKTMTCRSCGSGWVSYEEKETDVAIATAFVEDAAGKAFDTAIIVSADSDLCPAVRSVRRLHPTAKLVAAFPPRRRSDDLRRAVDASLTIARSKLAHAQLPDQVLSPDGRPLPRPAKWR